MLRLCIQRVLRDYSGNLEECLPWPKTSETSQEGRYGRTVSQILCYVTLLTFLLDWRGKAAAEHMASKLYLIRWTVTTNPRNAFSFASFLYYMSPPYSHSVSHPSIHHNYLLHLAFMYEMWFAKNLIVLPFHTYVCWWLAKIDIACYCRPHQDYCWLQ